MQEDELKRTMSVPTYDHCDTYVAGQYMFNYLRTFLAAAGIDASLCKVVIELPDRDIQRQLVSAVQRDSKGPPRSAGRIGNHSGIWQGVEYEFSVKGWNSRPALQSERQAPTEEDIAQLIEDELCPIFGAGPYETLAKKIVAMRSAYLQSEAQAPTETMREIISDELADARVEAECSWLELADRIIAAMRSAAPRGEQSTNPEGPSGAVG